MDLLVNFICKKMPIIERINTKDRTRPIKGDLVGLFDQPKIRLAIALSIN